MNPAETLALLEFLVDRIEVGVFAIDRTGKIALWNRFMALHSGKSSAQAIGGSLFELFPELPQRWLQKKIDSVFILGNYAFTAWEQRPYLFHFPHNRPVTGGVDAMRQNVTFLPVKNDGGEVTLVLATIFDYTDTAIFQDRLQAAIAELGEEQREQQRLIRRLEEAQNQLLQSEKLAAIGQLAAGVAHEINNPVGFVNSNLATLEKYLAGLMRLVAAYEKTAGMAPDCPGRAEIEAIKREIDYEFLAEDCGALVKESLDGLTRVRKIVQDLRDFSRVDASEWEMADLRQCLDSTLNIVWNEIKYKAEVIKDYAAIPEIECIASQLNQVFMNLLVNAAHAIETRGTITLRIGSDEANVWVEVADTGRGIPPENLKRIFEPFFTTKPVGKGTGLGLSLAWSIVQRHHGTLDVVSTLGAGTTFRVAIPRQRAADRRQSDAPPAPA